MIPFTLYNITYLLSQALGVFAVYMLMKVFFDEVNVKKALEIASFIGYYILTSSVYLLFNVPVVNFIVNILGYFGLTFLYQSSMKKKIFASLLVYVFGFCGEMIVVTLTGYINFPVSETNSYDSIFGVVAANILIFVISMAANNFKSIKNGNVLPRAYWIALFAVPVSSMYILAIIFRFEGLSIYEIASSVVAILVVNFMVFILFDRISLLYKERQESELIKQQNEYYANQLLLVEDLHTITSKLRHDIKNHLITINSFLEEKNIDKAKAQISEIMGVYQNKTEIVHTGYPAVDGLLNFKLRSASDLGIQINIKTDLPIDFNFSPFDLTVILGNLIDNALQAVTIVEKDRFIDLRMKCTKGMLFIKISNPYKTVIKKESGKIITSKDDKENHGWGLRNVDDILKKYNGTSDINPDNNIFTVTIALYLD